MATSAAGRARTSAPRRRARAALSAPVHAAGASRHRNTVRAHPAGGRPRADAPEAHRLADAAHPPGGPAPHWSEAEVRAWLLRVRNALLAEGFLGTTFQYPKKAQVWGLVRDHGDDLQLHVRAFANGVLESEVELHRRYLEHLFSPRRSAHEEVRALLAKHGIDTTTINEEYRTRTGADKARMPRTRTKVRHLATGALSVGATIAAVSIARLMRRRRSR